eukprot:COSAG02_NODE_415_length_22762_cov_133.681816_27_plen_311_part_00
MKKMEIGGGALRDYAKAKTCIDITAIDGTAAALALGLGLGRSAHKGLLSRYSCVHTRYSGVEGRGGCWLLGWRKGSGAEGEIVVLQRVGGVWREGVVDRRGGMTTRLRVTYFQSGRSKQQRLLIAVSNSSSVSESRHEIQKALASLTDVGATATVKTLWTQDGFLLPDSHGIGDLVESGDKIYASEKKTNVAPRAKREREEPEEEVEDAAPEVEQASAVKAEPQAKKPRAARGPSAYNLYMKAAMVRWKAENPGKTQKEAFSTVAGQWKTASENPKNAGTKSEPPTRAEDDDVAQDSDAESGARPFIAYS